MRGFRNYYNENFDVFIFIAIVFFKGLGMNLGISMGYGASLSSILGCFGSALLLSAILCAASRAVRVRLFILLDLFVSMVLFMDIVYDRYFYDVTSIALIKQAKLLKEVGEGIAALIHFKDVFLFLDIIVLIPILKNYYKKNPHGINKNMCIKGRIAPVAAYCLIGCAFIFGSVKAIDVKQRGILKTLYDKKYIVANIGDLNFHIFDIYKYVKNNVMNKGRLSITDKKRIKNWYEEKNKGYAGKKYGIMTDKNLIMVQLESFQGFLLNRKLNGIEITPNLNKLAKESLVFNNFHYQTSWGGTSDAELLTLTSMLPAREGAAFYLYSGNTYDSVVKELREKGYYTSVMHANRPGFWNRSTMYRSLGFDRFESKNNYSIDDIQGLGLSDLSFYKQSVQKLKSYPKPFFSFLITLSSHFPYKDSEDKIKNIIDVGDFEGSRMGDFLKSIRYSDEAIGVFIKELKAANLWDSSVVVFYGDHSAIQYEKRAQLAKLLYNREELSALEWFKQQRVISMIHFPKGQYRGENNIIGGQLDLPPTLGTIFGFKMNYCLGQDLLNTKKGFYLNNNGVWAYDNLVYLKNPDEIVDINTGKKLNRNNYKKIFDMVINYRSKSDAVLNNNLIKYFEGH